MQADYQREVFLPIPDIAAIVPALNRTNSKRKKENNRNRDQEEVRVSGSNVRSGV
jgi:hypothetical protein